MWIVSCNNRFLCQESRNVAHVHLYCIDKQALVLWDGDCQLPFITDPSLAGRKASRKQGSTLRPRIFSFPETWNSSGSASFQHICRRVVSTYFFQKNLPTKSIYLLNSSRENHLLVTHFLPLTKHTLKNQRQQTSQQKSQQKHPEPTELEGKTHRQAGGEERPSPPRRRSFRRSCGPGSRRSRRVGVAWRGGVSLWGSEGLEHSENFMRKSWFCIKALYWFIDFDYQVLTDCVKCKKLLSNWCLVQFLSTIILFCLWSS